MSIWQKILSALGYRRAPRVTFEMDQQLVQTIQTLAEREQRSQDDVASDLLSSALLQRELAAENLRRWHDLSPRECEVVALTCLGQTNRQIAASLHISPETVKTHMRNIQRKFEINSKAELRNLLSDWDFSAWIDYRD